MTSEIRRMIIDTEAFSNELVRATLMLSKAVIHDKFLLCG